MTDASWRSVRKLAQYTTEEQVEDADLLSGAACLLRVIEERYGPSAHSWGNTELRDAVEATCDAFDNLEQAARLEGITA